MSLFHEITARDPHRFRHRSQNIYVPKTNYNSTLLIGNGSLAHFFDQLDQLLCARSRSNTAHSTQAKGCCRDTVFIASTPRGGRWKCHNIGTVLYWPPTTVDSRDALWGKFGPALEVKKSVQRCSNFMHLVQNTLLLETLIHGSEFLNPMQRCRCTSGPWPANTTF